MKYTVLVTSLILASCTDRGLSAVPVMSKDAAPAAPAPVITSGNLSSDSDLHEWICAKGGDRREIQIVKNDDGCILNHSQNGQKAEEVNDTHGLKLCNIAEKRILVKLKIEGFHCI